MPIFNIPNVGQVNFPDSMSTQDIEKAAAKLTAQPKQYDPTEGMSGTEKFLAGAGGAMTRAYRGGKQLFGIGDQKELQAQIDEQKRTDAPLMKTGAGFMGGIVGGAVPTLPAMLIPGINTYVGATALGGLSGLAQPVASDESRASNAVFGALGGLLGQKLSNTVGTLAGGIKSTLTPEGKRLANVAIKEGIPLDKADITGSRMDQLVRTTLGYMPFTAGSEQAKNQVKQGAFNAAVGRRMGLADAQEIPQGLLSAQKDVIGKQIGNLSKQNNLVMTPQFAQRAVDVVNEANRKFSSSEAKPVGAFFDDYISKMSNGGIIPGEGYQGVRQELTRAMNSAQGPQKITLGDLRRVFDDAMNASITPRDAKQWALARSQYATAKEAEKALSRSAANMAEGNVSPATLAKVTKNADLKDVALAGQKFISDPMANTSKTASNQMMQQILTGGLLGGGGAVYGLMNSEDPIESAALYGAGAIALPKLLQTSMNSQFLNRIRLNGLIQNQGLLSMTPAAQNALRAAAIQAGIQLEPN
jgi:hypothetical protein